jgi:HAD superfamily hydrolase (TIGR01509 family)
VFDGIPDCLSALEKNDIAIAVATSKHSAVAAKNLQQLGISRFLPVVIGSDSVKEYKPNPEPLLTALNRLGIKPDASAIMVGDATVDIAMGHAAGVRTCAVTWGAHSLKDLQNSSPTFIARTVKAMTEYLLED